MMLSPDVDSTTALVCGMPRYIEAAWRISEVRDSELLNCTAELQRACTGRLAGKSKTGRTGDDGMAY